MGQLLSLFVNISESCLFISEFSPDFDVLLLFLVWPSLWNRLSIILSFPFMTETLHFDCYLEIVSSLWNISFNNRKRKVPQTRSNHVKPRSLRDWLTWRCYTGFSIIRDVLAWSCDCSGLEAMSQGSQQLLQPGVHFLDLMPLAIEAVLR